MTHHQPRVGHRATLYEAPRRVDEDAGVRVEKGIGNDGVDDVLDDVRADLLETGLRVVLCGDDDRVRVNGLVALVTEGNLGLAVRAQVATKLINLFC